MNYYEILGIKKDATNSEIKESYKKLVKKYHPDIYPGDKTFAEKKMKEINTAYDTLSDLEKKAEYDNTISTSIPHYQYTNPSSQSAYNDPYHSYTSNHHHYEWYNKYHSTNSSHYTDTHKDGSEHDYSTYVNYENRYRSYYRTKTGNPSYHNSYYTQSYNDFTDTITKNFSHMKTKNKIRMIILILGSYLIFLLCMVLEFQNIYHKNTIHSQFYTNSYNNTYLPSQNDNHSTKDKHYLVEDYLTEQEIQKLYEEYGKNSGYFKNIEEFKEFLEEYIFNNNLQ